MLPLAPLRADPPQMVTVDVHIQGMRSQKGVIRACLTRDIKSFPHCEKDPAARKLNIPAPAGTLLRFTDVVQGEYAVTVLHDENSNAKIDFLLGIPKEGVGFSNNPRLMTGPPSFASAKLVVAHANVETTIRIKYFL